MQDFFYSRREKIIEKKKYSPRASSLAPGGIFVYTKGYKIFFPGEKRQ